MDEKIQWDQIRNEYVTTNTSYRRLAAKYGVSLGNIRNHGRDEGWVDQRDQFVTETATAVREAAQKEAVEIGLKAIRDIGNVATDSIPIIQEQIKKAGNGTQAEASVGALRALLLIIRDCYGILTATEDARINLDRDKLALEREKAARGTQQENDDRIVIGSEEYGI